ncbi:MAG: hypothetical protein J6334_09150 [Kiritimatiellae bacterium]|nr:hypothetical protein [Kiritimatiellia bacterium]
MNRTVKGVTSVAIGVMGGIGILAVVFFARMTHISNIGAQSTILGQTAKDLYVIYSNYGFVGAENHSTSFTNSTDLLRDMLTEFDDYRPRDRYFPISDASPIQLEAPENMWVFVKNIPDDADDAVIVVATRNIDRDLLRMTLSEKELDQPLPFHCEPTGILKHVTLAIHKNGVISKIRHHRRSPPTFRHLFQHPFAVTNQTPPMSYLFPTGEWFPADGTKQKAGE